MSEKLNKLTKLRVYSYLDFKDVWSTISLLSKKERASLAESSISTQGKRLSLDMISIVDRLKCIVCAKDRKLEYAFSIVEKL